MAGVDRGPYKPFPFPVGAVFGNLTVTAWERVFHEGKSAGFCPRVVCSCGFEFVTTRYKLLDKHTTRCRKCHEGSFRPKRYIKYADAMPDEGARARLLNRLYAAQSRCHNPKDRNYKSYGARGIRVTDEWINDRAAFLKYVATLPGYDDPDLQMDRIDNNRGYEPGNIRFCTASKNINNRETVNELRDRIRELEAEIASLRSAQRGT